MEKFRERLNLALKQKGISQAEFARKMSTEPQNVNLWKVRGGIPRAHFIKACDVLDVDPAWLSEGTSKPPHAVKEPSAF
jgi:transcriptional regulator with XRE-family HTH domain